MDVKVKEEVDIENHAILATNNKNLLNEIKSPNIEIKKIKIQKDLADSKEVDQGLDLSYKHDRLCIKKDPDSDFKNKQESTESNETSAIYIKQEIIEDDDSAKEENPHSANNKSEKKDNNGTASKYKTRTEFQYRVTYTPHQRIELEKEFLISKFISSVRKSQLARELELSERQVKIWFQNRRSKERKHKKRAKGEEEAQTEQTIGTKPQIPRTKVQFIQPKPQFTSIDQIRNNILLVQQLQQTVLARMLANKALHRREN